MQDLGAGYAVLLHDPDLRQGLAADAQRPRRPRRPHQVRAAGLMLRRALARALRTLAARLEPAARPAGLPPAPGAGAPLAQRP
jgi:hypothetical protein